MAIVPFNDRDKYDIFRVVSRATPASSSLGNQVNKFRQGVSVRDFSDYRQSLSPIIMGGDFPSDTSTRFDHKMPKHTYGQPKLFEDPGPDGTSAPFIDIIGIVNPRDYINAGDTSEQYPVVLSTPFFLDPGQMDGVLEPLAIRGTFSDASSEAPFVAHEIRASLQGMSSQNVLKESTVISQQVEFKPVTMSAFFESSEGSHGPRIPGMLTGSIPTPSGSDGAFAYLFQPGIISSHIVVMVPFDDAFEQSPRMGLEKPPSEVTGSLGNGAGASVIMQALSGSFRDRGPFGVRFKSATSGFIFRETAVVAGSDLDANSGSPTILGTDSIAFAGLKR